jgi:hypothetical protein
MFVCLIKHLPIFGTCSSVLAVLDARICLAADAPGDSGAAA